MGAALFFTAAFVFTSGLQMITARMLDARKTIVIGFSFAMADVAEVYQEALTGVPIALQPIFGNSLVSATVCAVALNLIMRIGARQIQPTPREIVASDDGERLLAGYLLRQSAHRIYARGAGESAEMILHYDR